MNIQEKIDNCDALLNKVSSQISNVKQDMKRLDLLLERYDKLLADVNSTFDNAIQNMRDLKDDLK